MGSAAADVPEQLALGLFSAAALHSVARGTAHPLNEAIRLASGRLGEDGAFRLASKAVAAHGLGPLASLLPDRDLLPAPVRAYLSGERDAARAAVRRTLAVAEEVVPLLRSHGIEAVLYGELPLACASYREEALRPVPAIRLLLVPPATERRAGGLVGKRPGVEVREAVRFRALGAEFDATSDLLEDPVVRSIGSVSALVPSARAEALQLLFALAADFAGDGIAGISAIDFSLLGAAGRPAAPAVHPGTIETSGHGSASLLYAVDAVERFCPGSFDPSFVSHLAARVSVPLRERAAKLPSLRLARPRGRGRFHAATLLEGRMDRLRFLLRRPGPVD